jgi:hypothetical protein
MRLALSGPILSKQTTLSPGSWLRRATIALLYRMRYSLATKALQIRVPWSKRGRKGRWPPRPAAPRARTTAGSIHAHLTQGWARGRVSPWTPPQSSLGLLVVTPPVISPCARRASSACPMPRRAVPTSWRVCARCPRRWSPWTPRGLEVPVPAALAAAGHALAVVNPRQVQDAAKTTGRRATPDVHETHVQAGVAEVVRPTPRPLGVL